MVDKVIIETIYFLYWVSFFSVLLSHLKPMKEPVIVPRLYEMSVIHYIDLNLCALIHEEFDLMRLSQNCSTKSFPCSSIILPDTTPS